MEESQAFYTHRGAKDRITPVASRPFQGVESYKGASILYMLLTSMPLLAINIIWSGKVVVSGPYLKDILTSNQYQMTEAIGPLAGIIMGPTFGVLSDHCTHPWGRRRPFIFYGAIIVTICSFLFGIAFDIGVLCGDTKQDRTYGKLLVVFLYACIDLTANVVQMAVLLMVADVAGTRQITGAAMGHAWTGVGLIILAIYVIFIPEDTKSISFYMTIQGSLLLTIVIGVCCCVDEIPFEDEEKSRRSFLLHITGAVGSIYEGLATLPLQLSLYAFGLLLAVLGTEFYISVYQQFFGIYVYNGTEQGADTCKDTQSCSPEQETYNSGAYVAQLTTAGYSVFVILYMIIFPFLTKEFGAKRMIMYSMIPQCLIAIMPFAPYAILCLILSGSRGLTLTAYHVLRIPVLLHVLGEYADIGMYLGAFNSAVCIGQLIEAGLSPVLQNTGYSYNLPLIVAGVLGVLGVCFTYQLRLELYSL